MPKISKRVVDATTPDEGGGRFYVWDSECKGFGLLALPSGVKSYFYRYRTPEGSERRITIGQHGDWTAEQARDRAEELRQLVRTGRDPLGEKRKIREAPTVGDLLDAYLASEKFAEKMESTKATDRGRVERHLRPLLGKKHVHLVTSEDVRRAHTAIVAGKTARREKMGPRGLARVRGGAGAARQCIRLLSAIFGWARSEGLASGNPCEGVKTSADGRRETILEDGEAYARLFKALDRMEAEREIRSEAADCIRVIALTGARRGEIIGLRWEHVDLHKGRITLPRHKTAGSTGKPRIIGLPAAAQACIARQPKGKPGDLVFKPARGEGPISLIKPWRLVRGEAELPDGIGLHGLRHSLASHMAMAGAEAAEIMTALGHTQLSTVQGYIHWARDERQKLAERAASVALAGMAAAEGKQPADVKELKRARADG